jgi:hypothetical protein
MTQNHLMGPATIMGPAGPNTIGSCGNNPFWLTNSKDNAPTGAIVSSTMQILYIYNVIYSAMSLYP